MPIHIYWDNEDTKTIVRQDFVGKWEQADFDEMAQRFREMLASVDHTVHLIMDFKDNVTNPLAAISIFKTATSKSYGEGGRTQRKPNSMLMTLRGMRARRAAPRTLFDVLLKPPPRNTRRAFSSVPSSRPSLSA